MTDTTVHTTNDNHAPPLAGRGVVVTGGGRGIGRAVAVALAELGADVLAVARDPDVAILARGHSASQCRRLLELGAKFAVAENLEASLDLAREVLLKEIGDLDETKAILESFRRDYYARIETEAAEEAQSKKSQA